MYAPSKQGEQPSVEVSKEFMMSPNKLHLEASLDKELYYHGETVAVNVHIQNNSNKSVKKVKVSGKSSIFLLLRDIRLFLRLLMISRILLLSFPFRIQIINFIIIWTMKSRKYGRIAFSIALRWCQKRLTGVPKT